MNMSDSTTLFAFLFNEHERFRLGGGFVSSSVSFSDVGLRLLKALFKPKFKDMRYVPRSESSRGASHGDTHTLCRPTKACPYGEVQPGSRDSVELTIWFKNPRPQLVVGYVRVREGVCSP